MQTGISRTLWISMLLGAASFAVTSCSTASSTRTITPQEQTQRDLRAGFEIAQDFESRLRFKTDLDVSVFLRQVAEKLTAGDPNLKTAPVGVLLLLDRNQEWRDYGLPGNRVYLSTSLLRHIRFENEVAAAIAFELSHIASRDALVKLEEVTGQSEPEQLDPPPIHHLSDTEYFGSGGIFAFSEPVQLAAAEHAVKLLYSAGYDPRGLVALWALYGRNPLNSPFDSATLNKLQEATRLEIAQYSPLLNPIVRSDAFIRIQKRLGKL
jgi:predicted Zn-dependent protease